MINKARRSSERTFDMDGSSKSHLGFIHLKAGTVKIHIGTESCCQRSTQSPESRRAVAISLLYF